MICRLCRTEMDVALGQAHCPVCGATVQLDAEPGRDSTMRIDEFRARFGPRLAELGIIGKATR